MKSIAKGDYRDVQVEIEGFPFKVENNRKRYVEKDFGNEFIKQLYAGAAFPVSKSGFFVFSSLKCAKCLCKLPKATGIKSTFKGAMDVMGHIVGIEICAKSVVCQEFGLMQLNANAEVNDSINEALIVAINTLDITP